MYKIHKFIFSLVIYFINKKFNLVTFTTTKQERSLICLPSAPLKQATDSRRTTARMLTVRILETISVKVLRRKVLLQLGRRTNTVAFPTGGLYIGIFPGIFPAIFPPAQACWIYLFTAILTNQLPVYKNQLPLYKNQLPVY